MAAIFQIRRGDSSNTSSLVNGELYLNNAKNAFQIGTNSNPIKLLSLNTASISINNISTNDAGTYICVASNACGSSTSNQSTLSVNPKPLIREHNMSRKSNGKSLCVSIIDSISEK